jgi:hypothetical protein
MLIPITNIKVGFRAGALITAITIILYMYTLPQMPSNAFNRTLIMPLTTPTGPDINKSEAELPPTMRKSAPWILNIYLFRQ